MRIVVLGLSLSSSWGNGHATTYRSLLLELSRRGHDILFLERNQPWYASARDLSDPEYCDLQFYESIANLQSGFTDAVAEADCVIVGSFVPDGVEVATWVTRVAGGKTAFYDIDTPETLARLDAGKCEYLSPELVPLFDCYLSFSGGPLLERIERDFHSPEARTLYCSVDPAVYYPETRRHKWLLGYLGTYSEDRQGSLDQLLLEPARREQELNFVVAGSLYPSCVSWPANVERLSHLSPAEHRAFYNSQTFTLNVTRAAMARAGYSPSVRLFEAAACGIPIITDHWAGLETFFRPGLEILVARSPSEMRDILRETPELDRRAIGERARQRVLGEHTATHRAAELEMILGIPARAGEQLLQEAATT